MNNFISEIKINKLRHLHDLTIQLGDTKKNLILTGKNGSGKTSLLQNLNKFVVDLLSQSSNIKNFYTYKDRLNTLNIIEHKSLFDSVNRYANCYPVFNDNDFYNAVKADKFDFIYAFFQAKRQSQMTEAKSIEKITLSSNKTQKLNQDFLRYIVNLKAKKSFANDDGDVQTTKAIDDWFINFENMLKKLYSDESLTLKFDRDNFNFTIHRDNREPSDFNTQSDGFSAILDIVTELILKVESTQRKKFDCEGIVLIDELETHLHVELQKNILPLLTSFFPNMQFIVTTHSPFVLQSIENCVIFDLETHVRLEDLTDASYTGLIRKYFGLTSEYSHRVEEKITRFQQLSEKPELTDEEADSFIELDAYFRQMSPLLSPELYQHYQQALTKAKQGFLKKDC